MIEEEEKKKEEEKKEEEKKEKKNKTGRRRHGLHLQCQQCGIKNNLGGYDDAKQFARIIREHNKSHSNHDGFTLKQSYHAAELAHAFTEQTTAQAYSGSTYTDISGGTISNTSFTAGKKYLIVATATSSANSNGNTSRVRVVHGSTEFADSQWGMEPNTANVITNHYVWYTVWTAVSSEDIKIQHSANSTGTGNTDQVTVTAIKLSDDLTENTDWFYNEVAASTSMPSSSADTSTNNAEITFTPASASQDWLVLSKSRHDTNITSGWSASRIVRSGEASSTSPFAQTGGEDSVNDFYQFTLARIFTLGAASNTFTEKSYGNTSGSAARTHSGIFALNLHKLRNHAFSYSDSSVTDLSATVHATNVATANITPDVQGDVWCFGFMTVDLNTAGLHLNGRLQVDDTDQPGTQSSDDYNMMEAWHASDENIFAMQTMENLTAASHTIDLDGSVETAASGTGARAKLVMAVTMELPASGTAHKQVINETVGLTEAMNMVRSRIKAVNETVAITENIAVSMVKVRTINETLGISETLNKAMNLVRVFNETIGITENMNHVRGLAKVINENVALTEAINQVRGQIAVVNETVGITENINKRSDLVRVINESVAITEAVNFSRNLVRILNESVSIQEALNQTKVLIKNVNETVSLTEAINTALGKVRVINDPVAITETINHIRGLTYNVNETVAVTEQLNKLQNMVRVLNESVSISENVNKISNKIRVVNETIGIGEAHNIARNLVRIQNEQIAVTETLNKHGNLNRVINETVAILEQAEKHQALTRVVNETLALTEALNTAIGRVRIINETVGITELVNSVIGEPGLALSETINETLNISETINYVLGKVRVINETVSINEGDLVVRRDLARTINESVSITESLNKLANIVRVINEDVHLIESLAKVQSLVRTINETVNIEESANQIRGLTRVINETIGLPESQMSAPGKAKVIDEVLGIMENIVVKLELNVGPPPPDVIIPPPSGSMAGPLSYVTKRGRKYAKSYTHRPRTTRYIRQRVRPELIQPQKPLEIVDLLEKQRQERQKIISSELKQKTITVESPRLTLRWNNEGAIDIDFIRTKLITDSLIASMYRPPKLARAITIAPVLRQSENKEVILLKKTVTSPPLNIKWNQTTTVESPTLTLRWDQKQEVGNALTIRHAGEAPTTTVTSKPLILRWDQIDSEEWQQTEFLRQAMEVYEELESIVTTTTTSS